MQDATAVNFERFNLKCRYTKGVPCPLDSSNLNSHTLSVVNTRNQKRDHFIVWSKSRNQQIRDNRGVLAMFKNLLVAGMYGSLPITAFCEQLQMDLEDKTSLKAWINMRDKADRMSYILTTQGGILDTETEHMLPDGSSRVKIDYLVKTLAGMGI